MLSDALATAELFLAIADNLYPGRPARSVNSEQALTRRAPMEERNRISTRPCFFLILVFVPPYWH